MHVGLPRSGQGHAARRGDESGGRHTDTDTIQPRVREPARVYPAPDADGCWLVEAPVAAAPAPAPLLFSGPNAQKMALRYAYEAFGSARFFPF
jgi:hypothetical protein